MVIQAIVVPAIASGVALIVASPAVAQQAGSIRGVVYDKDFSVPLAFAQVSVAELNLKATATEDGNFVLANVPPGTYTLVFMKDGYVREVKGGVVVSEGALTDVEVSLTGEFTDMDEFVVQEVKLAGSEQGLLQLRFESPALMDSIGSDLMKRAAASDAAAALNLVSGATVQEGKFAVIRGLPDRYVSSQMNGVRLPTADAEKRAVELDQFPAAAIDSVQVSKTFTPDQQGDASGGAVNVVLKEVPDELTFSASAQYGFNSQASRADRFLTYNDGGVNFWGFDDGRRDIQYDNLGQNWTGAAGVTTGSAPIDTKWTVSGGGSYEIDDGVKIGGFASFFYERDSSYFDNGVDNSYWVRVPGGPMVPETVQGVPEDGDFKTKLYDITQSSTSVQWGALGTFGLETENHNIGLTILYTHDAVDTVTLAEDTRGKAYFFPGYDPNNPTGPGNAPSELSSAPYLRLETLDYVERTTQTIQLTGQHTLPIDDVDLNDSFGFRSPVFEWSLSGNSASFNEPDKRQFGSLSWPESFSPGAPPFIPPSVIDPIQLPFKPDANFNLGNFQRIWKTIEQDSTQYALSLKFPFEQWTGDDGFFKFGYFNDDVSRDYNQDTFSNFGDNSSFAGDWSQFWSASFPYENHPITDGPPFVDVDYNGIEKVEAWYAMLDLPVTSYLEVIAGARFESSEIGIQNFAEEDATWFPPGSVAPVALNPGDADVNYSQDDVLPSLALVLTPIEEVTIRAAFAQTIARQTFRELTPIIQQEFLGGPIFIGNPELQMSSLNNYDLRVDYVPYAGALLSGSVFYKEVTNPIEYVQRVAGFTFTTPVNYPQGTLLGFEFEVRQDLGHFFEGLEGLNAGFNATFIDSQVDLPDDEIAALSQPNIQAATTSRAMTGAPENLFNFYVTYDVEVTGTQLGLFYTVVGDTLIAGAGVSDNNYVPDIWATSYGTLNLTVSQKIIDQLRFFFQAKNLTNPEIQTVYRSDFIGSDVLNTSYTKGIDLAVGLSLQLTF